MMQIEIISQSPDCNKNICLEEKYCTYYLKYWQSYVVNGKSLIQSNVFQCFFHLTLYIETHIQKVILLLRFRFTCPYSHNMKLHVT